MHFPYCAKKASQQSFSPILEIKAANIRTDLATQKTILVPSLMWTQAITFMMLDWNLWDYFVEFQMQTGHVFGIMHKSSI